MNKDEQLALLWSGKANREWEERMAGADQLKRLMAHAPSTALVIMPMLRQLFVAGFEQGARFEHERRHASSDDQYRKAGDP